MSNKCCRRCGINATDDYPLDIFDEHMRRDICIKLLRAELILAEARAHPTVGIQDEDGNTRLVDIYELLDESVVDRNNLAAEKMRVFKLEAELRALREGEGWRQGAPPYGETFEARLIIEESYTNEEDEYIIHEWRPVTTPNNARGGGPA